MQGCFKKQSTFLPFKNVLSNSVTSFQIHKRIHSINQLLLVRLNINQLFFLYNNSCMSKNRRSKGNNKSKKTINHQRNPHKITQAYKDLEADIKTYEMPFFDYWQNYYNNQQPQMTKMFVSPFTNMLMEPLLILPEHSLINFSSNVQPYTSIIGEKQIIDLGLSNPLGTEDFQSHWEKVKDPLSFPYSCIGMVTFRYRQTTYFSTGTIIGARTVLTSAESCYSMSRQSEHLKITFTPSFKEGKGITFKAKRVFVPSEFKDFINPERLFYNFCFIQVDTDINLMTYFGSLPVRLQNDDGSLLPNYKDPSILCGFIADESGVPTMIKTHIKITDNFDVIRYQLECAHLGGLLGSPILSNDHQIIGLHNFSFGGSGISSYGLATISWLFYDFVQNLPKTQINKVQLYIPHYIPSDTESIGKLYLWQPYWGTSNNQRQALNSINIQIYYK